MSFLVTVLLISFLLFSHSLPTSSANQTRHEQAVMNHSLNGVVTTRAQQEQEGRQLTSFTQPRRRPNIHRRKGAGRGSGRGFAAGGVATRTRGKTSAANPASQISYLLQLGSALAYGSLLFAACVFVF